MKRHLFLVAFALVGCRDVVGIHDIAFDDSGTAACNGSQPTLVFTSASAYDALFAQGGFVYAEVSQSGIDRCAITGCTTPTNILTAKATDTFEYATLSTTAVDYTIQKPLVDGGTNGEIHTMGFDGTNDAVALSTPLAPSWIAISGSRTFWIDDQFFATATGDTLQCLGCGGSNMPWITGMPGGAYGLVADANNVYVLADSANLTDYDVLSCSVLTACAAAPRTVISAIDFSTVAAQIASDGTYFYIARENHQDVVRVDGAGATTQVLTSQDVVAIAIDATAGNLYYATSTGIVGRTKTDGTAPATLACNQSSVSALAVDNQNVYFIAGATTSNVYKLPK